MATKRGADAGLSNAKKNILKNGKKLSSIGNWWNVRKTSKASDKKQRYSSINVEALDDDIDKIEGS